MKNLKGTEKLANILAEFPETKAVFNDLEIKIDDQILELELVKIAQKYKIPLQILLNNLSKKIGIEVDWPKIYGSFTDKTHSSKERSDQNKVFQNSTNLRTGKPENIKKIIAIHSGKGGVGKTFTAINLAFSASKNGLKVGLLDLDIDCPNVFKQLKVKTRLIANAEQKIKPFEFKNVKLISMAGILENESEPVLWRGPILTKAIEQLINDTNWGDLDFLFIDLPPGTSDVPLTLFNLLKPDAVITVSTSQQSSVIDSAKSIKMAESLGVKVLGILENLSGEIFGRNKVKEFAERANLKFLGAIEMKKDYADEENLIAAEEDAELRLIFEQILKLF